MDFIFIYLYLTSKVKNKEVVMRVVALAKSMFKFVLENGIE